MGLVRPVSAILAIVSLGNLVDAQAQAEEARLGWDTLVSASRLAFADLHAGPGRARVAGSRRASQQVAGRWQQLQLQSFDDFNSGPSIDHPWEISHTVQASLNLGNLSSRQREAWLEVATAHEQSEASREAAYVLESLVAFEQWWLAAALASHAQKHHTELVERFEGMRSAAEQGHLSAADWMDVEVEIARSAATVAAAVREAQSLAAPLAELGLKWTALDHPGPDALETPPPLDPSIWDRLGNIDVNRTQTLPESRALQAAATSLRAQADATRSATPWQLFVGVSNRFEGPNAAWLAGTVGLTIPLSNPGASAAEPLLAEASAAENSAGLELRKWRLRMEAMKTSHEALALELERVNTGLFRVATERAEAASRAYGSRLITSDRVARAWRDAIEADHQRAEIVARLWVHARRAEVIGSWLDTFGGNP